MRIEKLNYLLHTGNISDEEFKTYVRYINGDEQPVEPVKKPVPERIVTPDELKPTQTRYSITVNEGTRLALREMDSLCDYSRIRVAEFRTGYFRKSFGLNLKWAHIITRERLHAHDVKIESVEKISDDNSTLKFTLTWLVEKTMPDDKFINGMNKWLVENRAEYDFDKIIVEIKPVG